MKVGSLFSGAGCGDLGLEWAGFEHAWFCEVDDYARKILALRWPGKPIYGDIKEVDFTTVPSIDVLAGGFPCQDVSTAGPGHGLKGERSGLWSEFARAIGEIRPRYALIENSPSLATRGLDVVLSDLAALGYDAEWHCIPANALGALHIRDRLWIVAYPSRLGFGKGRKAIDLPQAHGRQNGQMRSVFGSTSQRSEDMALIRQQIEKNWCPDERGLERVADVAPDRMDRIRCTGNGQVPICTYFIGRLIQAHARQTYSKSGDQNEN